MDTGLFSLGTFWGSEAANHLWQSTLFAAAAWMLTLLLRKNRARVRYWIWVAVSAKFLIPFSLLVNLGGSMDIGQAAMPQLDSPEYAEEWIIIKNINQPFSSPEPAQNPSATVSARTDQSTLLPGIIVFLWICGAIACLVTWLRKGSHVSKVIHKSKPLLHGPGVLTLLKLRQSGRISGHIRLASSKTSIEPGVFGIFKPVLLLPDGMAERLRSSELEAILEHELSHIRCRDNLVAAFHMFVEALFWFHPMVWWIGSRLVHEREKACDEAVLQSGKEPQAYAEGILKVCEFYLKSPLACISGVAGSNLKKRIEGIMKQHIGCKLSTAKKLTLLGACFLALGTPLLIGALSTQSGLAQSQDSPKPSFDVASIKPTDDCRQIVQEAPGRVGVYMLSPRFQPGRFNGCSSLKGFISIAYQVDRDEIAGAPDWSDSANYKIEAKAEDETDTEVLRLMLQSLLEERFGLRFHNETREKPVYALVVSKGGHKLKQSVDENGNPIESLPSAEQMKEVFEKRMEQMKKSHSYGDSLAAMPPGTSSTLMTADGHRMTGKAMSMEVLANALTGSTFPTTGRRVVDSTGLTGLYDIQLHYRNPFQTRTGSDRLNPPAEESHVPTVESAAPTIYTALEEQLGLKLKEGKAPQERIVIESVERPTEN